MMPAAVHQYERNDWHGMATRRYRQGVRHDAARRNTSVELPEDDTDEALAPKKYNKKKSKNIAITTQK